MAIWLTSGIITSDAIRISSCRDEVVGLWTLPGTLIGITIGIILTIELLKGGNWQNTFGTSWLGVTIDILVLTFTLIIVFGSLGCVLVVLIIKIGYAIIPVLVRWTANWVTNWIAGAIVAGIAGGIVAGNVGVAIVSTAYLFRLYYYPFHIAVIWARPRKYWYAYHPVSWDDLCFVPFVGLHKLLVALVEEDPEKAPEVERLVTSYPSQRTQALRAKVIILARKAKHITELSRLEDVALQLPEGEKGFLGEIKKLRAWIGEISLLQIRLNTIIRSAFREPTAALLVKEIENFRHRIAGLHEPLVTEFRAAATQWLAIAERQLDEARRGATRELTPQVFRAGDPVDREQEAFVPRYAVIGELEQQIMLSAGCPGIVLYGRRRMGKSTILRNLTDFLPTNVTPVVVSMQRPEMFTSIGSLTGFVSRELRAQLDGAHRDNEEVSDLTGFFQTLQTVNDRLEAGDKRLLLAVDEYEAIDKKIAEGVFPLDLLDTIRESIQSHRRITWVFAGSHEITELGHAAWTSYLVSARTIEVPFFTLAETRLLLTDPVKHSTLWRNNPDKRPRFDAAFWGEEGIERIQHEAGGWPHLVQLIAETIVDLINYEEQAAAVTPELMEQALEKAVVRGHNVLYELLRRESALPGEWDYITGFRRAESQPPPADERIAFSLRRRMLVEEESGLWRLRVPLMARWLRVRGQ